jgi:hypothetical protein
VSITFVHDFHTKISTVDDINPSINSVHYFHTKISTVDDINPSINNATLAINYRLVEIETILVDCRTSQAAKKKCKERELLKLAYWKINRPK